MSGCTGEMFWGKHLDVSSLKSYGDHNQMLLWEKCTARFYFCFTVVRDEIIHLNECFILISAIKTISH